MNKHEKLAWSVVRPLEQYLIRKKQVGSGVYDVQLEVLLGRVDVQVVSDPFAAEAFERFKVSPADPLVTQTLYLQLVRHLRDDPEFGSRLREALRGAPAGTRRPRTRRTRWLVLWTAGVAVLLLTGFLWGRSTSPRWPGEAEAPPTAETSARPAGTPPVPSGTTSTAVPAPTGKHNNGTTPVLLETLPNHSWQFGHGERDVRGTTYPSSVWAELPTCGEVSVEQQFQVTGFRRLEVPVVGADSATARASVKFEVLGDDNRRLEEVVVVEGGASEVVVELPYDTSTITLRNSLVNNDVPDCEPVHAVWGSPRVLPAGR
ncbi:hypothetical protein [Saccharothrix sp. Mg75]|uniref:hypothetical protein n=1 Tax=Saccharothrix sp. Mg75 TaxID=3445357 RepID=UPI003EEABA8E